MWRALDLQLSIQYYTIVIGDEFFKDTDIRLQINYPPEIEASNVT